MTGLCSITFRKLPTAEIIQLAKAAGLESIEWGGDIHVPPGDLKLARELASQTQHAGLRISSYGSYFSLLDPASSFAPVLETAVALSVPTIRIWAGRRITEPTDALIAAAAEELAVICDQAADKGLTISTEFHQGSLTETADSCIRLIQATNRANLRTYWQPGDCEDHANNLSELRQVLPWLSNIHVFAWTSDRQRLPLAEGAANWQAYFALIAKAPHFDTAMLEFVRNDDPAALITDAATLKQLVADHT